MSCEVRQLEKTYLYARRQPGILRQHLPLSGERLTIIVMNNLDEDHCDTLRISGAIASIHIPAWKGKNPVKDW
jgi:hypothetical protein